jgi:hypothetical protein
MKKGSLCVGNSPLKECSWNRLEPTRDREFHSFKSTYLVVSYCWNIFHEWISLGIANAQGEFGPLYPSPPTLGPLSH